MMTSVIGYCLRALSKPSPASTLPVGDPVAVHSGLSVSGIVQESADASGMTEPRATSKVALIQVDMHPSSRVCPSDGYPNYLYSNPRIYKSHFVQTTHIQTNSYPTPAHYPTTITTNTHIQTTPFPKTPTHPYPIPLLSNNKTNASYNTNTESKPTYIQPNQNVLQPGTLSKPDCEERW